MDGLQETLDAMARAMTPTDVADIVRARARRLVKSDGVTFVLRDHDDCLYLDEDAITPLWKGSRFPLQACISGWVMLNEQIAVIPNIYLDLRVPHDAYRPTFVKSLVVVPVPQNKPVAAIGAYWAGHHEANWDEQYVLQSLANAAGEALRNMPAFKAPAG
jgi:GAF domain-containing protein